MKIAMNKLQLDEKNLAKIEELLCQSLNGHHLLFDNEKVAKILSRPTEDLDFFNFENVDKIQVLFTELIQRETYFDKLCYLQELDEDSYEILLRTYFHIVDNTALATTKRHH